MSNNTGETSFVLELGEQIVGEYETVGVVAKLKGVPDAGKLIITTKRVVFLRRESGLKKLLKSDTPAYKFSNQTPLWGISKISQGGKKTGKTTYRRFIVINGVRYFLENADSRQIEKILKESSKAAKNTRKTGN